MNSAIPPSVRFHLPAGCPAGYVDEWKDRLGVGDLLEELGHAGHE